MLTLKQLTSEVTEDEALTTILGILTQIGIQATSWQPGAIQLTFMRLIARVWSTASTVVRQITEAGFVKLSTGDFLTLIARHVFELERLEAQATIGTILLTNSAGAPTHTWAAGDIIVADAPTGTTTANAYSITVGGTLNPGVATAYAFKAQVAGQKANIAPGTTLYLWTPLVGVTATNPALLPASNTWVTTPGSDLEADPRLMARCVGRWSKLSYSNTDGTYRAWALDAVPALTRVTIGSAPGDGRVNIIGATALGAITTPQADAIEDYIYGVTDGVGRRPINDIVVAAPATTVTTPAITVTAYASVSGRQDGQSLDDYVAALESAIAAALLAYIGGVPIGGVKLLGGSGVVPFDGMLAACKVDNVISADLDIEDSITLAFDEIYLPTVTVNVFVVQPAVP